MTTTTTFIVITLLLIAYKYYSSYNNIIETIYLDDLDEFYYRKYRGNWFMKIHKKDKSKNDFINRYEYERIKTIKKHIELEKSYKNEQ